MKLKSTLIILLFCTLGLPGAAYAVTVFECIDEAGNSTFQDHCPPGTTPANERNIKTGAQDDTAAAATTKKPEGAEGTGDATITFYTTSTECDACLVIKALLDKYGASYTTKDISTDLAVRQELKDKSGGTGTSVSVPTVIINDQVIAGYNKEGLVKAMEGAGYKKSEPAAAPAPETEAEPETEQPLGTESPE